MPSFCKYWMLLAATALAGATGCMSIAQSMVGGPLTEAEQATPLRYRYDRFENRTRVAAFLTSTVGNSTAPPVMVMALFDHPDSALSTSTAEIVFGFSAAGSSRYRDWTFLRDDDLALVLDGSTRIHLEGVRRGSVGGGVIAETVLVPIPESDLTRIVHSTRIEGRVGPVEFVLDSASIGRLKSLRAYARREPGALRPVPARECALCPKF
jgi:hypothetical protein